MYPNSSDFLGTLYIKHWLRQQEINLTHSHVVAINFCNCAYIFDISRSILTWYVLTSSVLIMIDEW